MIKNLNKKLLAGTVVAGVFFSLSGTKASNINSFDVEVTSNTLIEEVPSEDVSLEEEVTEQTTESVFEDNDLVPAVRATTDVNIRSVSNINGNICGLLREGETLKYYTRLDNGWYVVNYNDSIAYVSGDYVCETFIINRECLGNVCITNPTYLYNDSNNNFIIRNIPYLEMAKVYGEVGDKYYVQCDGDVGYIDKKDTSLLTGNYVVVDISDQKLTLYNNQDEILSTSVVTGKDSTPSDTGLFDIDFMTTDTVLRGDNYASHVNYWMPYNGGEGLHDATWRGYFGGDIYHENGSHGCINMPLDMAGEVYSHVNAGDKVLVKE